MGSKCKDGLEVNEFAEYCCNYFELIFVVKFVGVAIAYGYHMMGSFGVYRNSLFFHSLNIRVKKFRVNFQTEQNKQKYLTSTHVGD